MRANPLSYEYIRGLVEGEGCFTFCTSKRVYASGRVVKRKVPAFSISMHERDEYLLELLRDTLGLTNTIYNYKQKDRGDGWKRGKKSILIVRELESLKNVIVPLFYKKLRGNKGIQFTQWMEKIGSDPEISPSFKVIYELYKSGFYDKNNKYS